MKKLILIICLLLQIPLFAQEGTNFRELTFEQALVAAKKEGKLVFVDCYTSWCAPCKIMFSKVFSQKKAGAYFNPRFVCVKFDMEKGEGVELAQRFNVHSYPTFLIVRADGTLQHKLIGAGELDDFIARVDKGLGKETNLWDLQALYEKGDMNKAQLIAFHEALLEAGDSEKATRVYNRLWTQLSDEERMSQEFWPIYKDVSCVIGSAVFDFLVGHLAEIRKNVGTEEVDNFLLNTYRECLEEYIMGYNNEKTPSFAIVREQIPGLGIAEQNELNQLLELAVMVVEQQMDRLADLIKTRMPSLTPSELKGYAFAYRGMSWGHKGNVPENYQEQGALLTRLVLEKMKLERDSMSMEDMKEYLLSIESFKGKIDDDGRRLLLVVGDRLLLRDSTSKDALFIRHILRKYNEDN